ncbi:MAG: hypothetical protein ACNA7Y_00565 [Gammaproteobacteria bacterium]
MNTQSIQSQYLDNPKENSVCWSAIVAGTIIALALTFLFNLLGIGLGFSAFSVDTRVINTLSMSFAIWFIVTGMVVALASGWVAGRFSQGSATENGILNGLLTWSLSMFFTIMLAASALGALIGGIGHTVGTIISSTTQGATAVSKQIFEKGALPDLEKLNFPTKRIKKELETILSETREVNFENLSEDTRSHIIEAAKNWLTADTERDISDARQKMIDILAAQTEMSKEEIESVIKKIQEKYETMKESLRKQSEKLKKQAINIIEPATHISGAFIILTFFILLIGASLSAIGGALGIRKRR